MKLYHLTRHGGAILANGFRDNTSHYGADTPHTGTWWSDRPLWDAGEVDPDEGSLFELVINEATASEYEWVQEGLTYREFLIPAAVVKSLGYRMVPTDDQ